MLDRLIPALRRGGKAQPSPDKDVWNMLDTFMTAPRAFGPQGFERLTPAVDVRETAEAVTVTAELPGMAAEDVELHVENNYLVLRGQKKRENEEKKENCLHRECSYGAFCRSIPLAVEVNAEKVAAKFKNGVLTVTLPKSEKSKTRRISIES